jgi:D-alanyl-D-alanine carboxypeptidase
MTTHTPVPLRHSTRDAPPPRRPLATRRRRARLAAIAVVLVLAAAGTVVAVRAVNPPPSAGPGTAGEDLPAEPKGAVPRAPTGTADTAGLAAGTRRAYLAARAAMAAQGLRMTLTSGYRSEATQDELYRQAIAKYGSPEAARIWVLPPSESQHVRGVAVDIAPREAAHWLDDQGVRYGLCRTMEWEWWHFEYRDSWRTSGCPPMRRR